MSIEVTSLVKRRIVGSPTKKAVLMFMADASSEDGSGIWTSKANMSADLEMAKRTVQNAISELISAGLIKEVGKRPCSRGYTTEYRIVLEAVQMLASTRAGDAPVQEMHPKGCSTFTPRGAGDAPKPSLEPSLEPSKEGNNGQTDLLRDEDAPKVDPLEATLSDFYEVFPKRTDKKHDTPAAIRPVLKAALKKISASELINCAKNYANSDSHKEGEFALKATNWLKREEWQKYQGEQVSEEQLRLRRIRKEMEEANGEVKYGLWR